MNGAGRHTAGITTGLILRYVRAHAGEEGVRTLLRLAGEARPVAQLADERGWSTYDQKIALFVAASALLGDPDVARHIGESVLQQSVGAPLKLLLRALGSPGQVLRNVAKTAPKFSTVCTMEAAESGRTHAIVTYRLHDGFQPHEMDCQLNIGLMSQAPVLFGLPPATIAHPECQVLGAERCVYKVRWQARHRFPWRRRAAEVAALRDQLASVTERTLSLQTTVADLVSPEDVDTVLARIALRACGAVHAQGFLLAVRPTEEDPIEIHHDGFTEAEARRLAGCLLDDEPDDHGGSWLITDIASAHRHYGRLAAIYPDGEVFFEEERALLASYARHAAVALDAATALEAAHERGETAGALLDLARLLSEPATRDEVARRLANAVPRVVGAERAVVLLWDDERKALSVRALHGYPNEMEDSLRALTLSAADHPGFERMALGLRPQMMTADGPLEGPATLLREYGTTGVYVVPIATQQEFLGVITVSNGAGRAPLREGQALEARMTGLADQAAIALQNAALLERLHGQIHHDALTGLPNALMYADRLQVAMTHAERNGEKVAVLFLDLDRFKNVNDSLGHAAGDRLLQHVSDRLAATLRQEDTVARLSGDEFTLLVPGLASPEDASTVATKLLDAFALPFHIEGTEIFLTASIGIAVYPMDGTDADALLKNADAAMYRAKEQGRNTFRHYTQAMNARALARLTLESALHRALDREELVVHYQPQISLATGRIVGAEALVRWQQDTSLAFPGEFIPIAEESGLIVPIDELVLRAALAQNAAWRAAGLPPIRVAVNFSGRLLQRNRFVRLVEEALTETGTDAASLQLEILGSIAVHVEDPMVSRLRELRALGVSFAIDDFGTNYSFLSHLKRFPIETLKLDQSFVRDITTSPEDAAIVRAVIAMAHGLDFTVVAEGVERDAELEFLRTHGCDEVQGYLYSPAVPAGEFERLLRADSGVATVTPIGARRPAAG